MTNTIPLRFSPVILDEMQDAIHDAVEKTDDPTNITYLKIHHALQKKSNDRRYGITVTLNAQDVAELKSRAEYNVGRNGVCQENLDCSYSPEDRRYWNGRMRSYKAFLTQLNKLTQISNGN